MKHESVRQLIIGHGDIAKVLPKRDDLLFFASGVSNSGETRESEYQREIDLLMSQDKKQHIVYFSSLAVINPKEEEYTRYIWHKRHMEELIKKHFSKYTIVRLGNIDWGTNQHTLINYLKNKTERGEKIKLENVYRYIVSKEEFLYWINLIPKFSCEINIVGRRMLVKDIFNEYITILKK